MSINPDDDDNNNRIITKSSSSDLLKRSAPPWEFSSRRSSRIAAPDLDQESSDQIPPLPRLRTWLRLCGCSFALLLIAAMLFLILLFTAFRIKDPLVSLSGISLLSSGNGTILVDVKLRNPNAAAFRFVAGETAFYYGESTPTVVGEAPTPPGRVKARGTVHMRVAVPVIAGEKLSGAARSSSSSGGGGVIRMRCITRIPGDVKVISKRHMVVKVICIVNYDSIKGELTAGDCVQFTIS